MTSGRDLPNVVPHLDTNVIIRFLTTDDVPQQRAASRLFDRIDNRSTAMKTSHAVFAEAVYVLSAKRLYALDRQRIVDLLTPLARLTNLRIPQRGDLLRALHLFGTTKLHFVDALLAAAAERSDGGVVCSFDRKFDSIPGVTRLDPSLME